MEQLQVENVPVAQPNWWERIRNWIQQMPEWERRFFFATCALSVVVVLLVIAVTVISVLSAAGGPSYCESKACIRTGALIIKSMNSSADPCTDFYEFACGGWKHIGGVEEDDWSIRVTRHTLGLGGVLLSKINSDTDFEAVKKARSLHRSCMDTEVLESLGLEPLFDLLESVGLPRGVPNNSTAVDFDLSRTLARMHRTLGLPVFFDVSRETNDTFLVTPTYMDIGETLKANVLKEIDAWVKREKKNSSDLTSGTVNDDWQPLVEDVHHIGEEIDALRPDRFSVKYGLMAYNLPRNFDEYRLSASNITTTIYEGTVPQNVSNTFYYEVYMETLLEGRPEFNWSLNNGTLRLGDPEYQSLLLTILQYYGPLKIQMLIWMQVVKHFGVHTTAQFEQRVKGTSRDIFKSKLPKAEECAHLVIKLMPLAVEHLFAQVDPMKYVTEKVTAMANEIQTSQKELVQKAEWLNDLGRKELLKYLETVKIDRIGYIDWVTEGRGLDEFYADVKIHDGKLLRTMADIQAWQLEDNFQVAPLIGRLRSDKVLANAHFNPLTKGITVRPIFLRFPYYPLGLEALNYGAMGSLLGHEFGHALDNAVFLRKNYFSLEMPSIARVDYFSNCTMERVREISNMLNMSVDPYVSINEDFADITGTKKAWYTFNKIRHGPEPRLPGLENLTHDQLFFLAFANTWCSNGKTLTPGVQTSPHSANPIRILNAVTDIPEFAEVWKCPPDSPMNPIKKCTLW